MGVVLARMLADQRKDGTGQTVFFSSYGFPGDRQAPPCALQVVVYESEAVRSQESRRSQT
jgi:hypothetical protein